MLQCVLIECRTTANSLSTQPMSIGRTIIRQCRWTTSLSLCDIELERIVWRKTDKCLIGFITYLSNFCAQCIASSSTLIRNDVTICGNARSGCPPLEKTSSHPRYAGDTVSHNLSALEAIPPYERGAVIGRRSVYQELIGGHNFQRVGRNEKWGTTDSRSVPLWGVTWSVAGSILPGCPRRFYRAFLRSRPPWAREEVGRSSSRSFLEDSRDRRVRSRTGSIRGSINWIVHSCLAAHAPLTRIRPLFRLGFLSIATTRLASPLIVTDLVDRSRWSIVSHRKEHNY